MNNKKKAGFNFTYIFILLLLAILIVFSFMNLSPQITKKDISTINYDIESGNVASVYFYRTHKGLTFMIA